MTGGFPPFSQRVEIAADGEVRIELRSFDSPKAKVSSMTVPEAELQSIREELDAADLGSLEEPELTCSDCPLYELSYAGEKFEADMLTIPPELESAFRQLDALIG